jgi:signal transduction histidine kinase
MNKKLINIIFGVSLVVLLIMSILTYDRLTNITKYSKIIDNGNKVLLTLSNLRSGFYSSVANQRIYLITKDKKYFDQFQSEKDSLRHSIQLFKNLTRDNDIHQFYIKKLEIEANQRVQSLLLEIINDTSTAVYKFKQLELIQKNDTINSTFSTLLENMNLHENRLLSKRLKLKEFEEQFTPFLLFILALSALALLSYSFVLISDELKIRNEATELLESSIEELNRSNKELEQYAYVASHDLQEPLRKIRLFSEKLQNDHSKNLDKKGLDLLNRMNSSAEKMTLLIKDLLSLSKLLADNPTYEKTDLNLIVTDVLTNFEDVIASEKINITSSILPNIQGNQSQLHQLFQNIIGNAIKFRQSGKKNEISIRYTELVKYEEDTPYKFHQISIKDNGKGFNNSFKEKMFTIFGRLDKTSNVDGTGIGLSICKRIMENHGGYLDAEGKENVGATFHLYFPQDLLNQ